MKPPLFEPVSAGFIFRRYNNHTPFLTIEPFGETRVAVILAMAVAVFGVLFPESGPGKFTRMPLEARG